ncbi:UPF0183-domain-containing protein [Auriscalpium vulgare]|uniref:UPF0183-domain-containing protein n=1 Tax=Auriscalpium vulgare TaxID=40419 RepID=A0ACB8S9Z0_9AGAM|nr:UPF0183-domain-containing protein [Auriscalpium vulgare]
MFSSLDLDIQPGEGLGIFQLGASLWAVLDLLRTHHHAFPHVAVQYDADAPTTPVLLHIRPHLDLLFSPAQQRLHTIAVRSLRDPNPPLTLTYKSAVLSSSSKPLRRVDVSRAFGPTYPGRHLQYPGVRFLFEDDANGEKGERTQEVARILVTQADGHDGAGIPDALGEPAVCPAMYGDVAEAIVKVHEGVDLRFYAAESPIVVRVRLGLTTAQDLLTDLGPPLRTFYKEDDRMAIHGRTHPDVLPAPSYFYNYFQYGMDFLIADGTHVVTKIVMHSNIPGTALFQRYKRCPWQIEGRPEDDEDDSPPRVRFEDRVETISHFLAPGEAPPSMHFNRTDEEETLTLRSATTRLLGFDGIILEATEGAQVVGVTLV